MEYIYKWEQPQWKGDNEELTFTSISYNEE